MAFCIDCGCFVTDNVRDYSLEHHSIILCYNCQRKDKENKD